MGWETNIATKPRYGKRLIVNGSRDFADAEEALGWIQDRVGLQRCRGGVFTAEAHRRRDRKKIFRKPFCPLRLRGLDLMVGSSRCDDPARVPAGGIGRGISPGAWGFEPNLVTTPYVAPLIRGADGAARRPYPSPFSASLRFNLPSSAARAERRRPTFTGLRGCGRSAGVD